MGTTFDHNKLLKIIAKRRLTSFGIIQKGNSRTFLKDNGWYIIVIEFQPSGFDTGSFLNIGVDFNFYARDYFAFSYGYREKEFVKAETETQFEEIINNFCDIIIERVGKFETDFGDFYVGAKTLEILNSVDPWTIYELAILFGLNGNLKKAASLLNEVKNMECEYDYEFERKKLVEEILVWLNDKDVFSSNIKALIDETRLLKKLPVIDINNVISKKNKPKKTFSLLSLFGLKSR